MAPKLLARPFVLPGPPALSVEARQSARARRLTLRVPPGGRDPVLTWPARVPRREAEAFLKDREAWLRDALGARPPPLAVRPGAALPVEGVPLPVVAAARARLTGAAVEVPAARAGPAAAALLKARARARLVPLCERFAARLGRDWGPLALRDTRGRWGSCTARGRLMFSWRLAMAPPEVLAYVAAHEAAHLLHMDHSPAFWDAVEGLDPGWRARRAWLRAEGPALHRWSFA